MFAFEKNTDFYKNIEKKFSIFKNQFYLSETVSATVIHKCLELNGWEGKFYIKNY